MNIEISINGRKARVKDGSTIMTAAKEMGLYIPHFCWHPRLSAPANCRMCLVDVEKVPKPVPACVTAVMDGMEVRTDSPKAKEAQNSVMEFLLINHPLDCPICDQGGECQLQDLAVGYGMSKSRYAEEKRVVFEKNLGPLISTDMTRCIHCTRCVRFGHEIGGIMELGMAGRGEHSEIMPFIERTVDSELSGNMIDVCPVGALTSKPFRFTARPWELQPHPGVSPHDSWGSQIFWQVKGAGQAAAIKRVVPRECGEINDCWISDRDRFSYLGLSASDRAASPLMRPRDAKRFSEASWREAMSTVAEALLRHASTPERMGFLAAPNATCEEMFLWNKIARGLGCDNVDHRLRQRDFSAEAPAGLGFRINDLASAGAIMFVGANPAREQPLLAARLRGRRRRLFAVGAEDIGEQIPARQLLARPSAIAGRLESMNASMSDAPPGMLVNVAVDPDAEAVAKAFSEAPGAKYIILGDAICGSERFGAVMEQARSLAEKTGATLGSLTSGANGAGALKIGLYPQSGGMHAGAMLDGKLAALMLLGCEPQDFAEPGRARAMLAAAEFSCAVTPFYLGLEGLSHVVLPSAAPGETDGSYVSGEMREQKFAAAAAPPGEARPGWKILRLLGEELGLSGFDFSALGEVREAMAAAAPPPPIALSEPSSEPAEISRGMFELVGGSPIYDVDMLVRRASALQETAQGKGAGSVFLHPDDMKTLGAAEGDSVLVGQGGWRARAFSSRRLAAGSALAYPPDLRPAAVSIAVESARAAAAGA